MGQLNEHKFKLLKTKTFEEKVQFFDMQIETFFKELCDDENN